MAPSFFAFYFIASLEFLRWKVFITPSSHSKKKVGQFQPPDALRTMSKMCFFCKIRSLELMDYRIPIYCFNAVCRRLMVDSYTGTLMTSLIHKLTVRTMSLLNRFIKPRIRNESASGQLIEIEFK